MKTADPESAQRLISKTPRATRTIGRKLGQACVSGDWIGLTGDLGAGKTCLTQGLAAGLGVPAEVAITSPTFTILQSYPGRLILHHLDLYRIATRLELIEIGYEELCSGPGVCAVEWCDRIPEAIPDDDGLLIRLRLIDERTREIHLESLGPRGAVLAAALKTG
jgi:tRNA threonylcarbamoyladenosine biosynthesis protein TsaE